MGAVALALCGAALWGTGDFLGGLATRRLLVLVVLFWSQLVGLLGVAVWIAVSGDPRPGAPLLYAAGGGIAGAVGLGCLYRGMAVGAMAIVAPISATAPVVPLAFSVATGDAPSGLQWAGVLLALAGIVLVSREPGTAGAPVAAGAGLALVAALGFGIFLVGLGEAATESASWATGAARLASVSVVALALVWRRMAPRVPSSLAGQVVAVGACDTGANALIALAASVGSIGIVGVLSSLYPISTILLARAVLHERLGVTRAAGGALALAGAALIAAA